MSAIDSPVFDTFLVTISRSGSHNRSRCFDTFHNNLINPVTLPITITGKWYECDNL